MKEALPSKALNMRTYWLIHREGMRREAAYHPEGGRGSVSSEESDYGDRYMQGRTLSCHALLTLHLIPLQLCSSSSAHLIPPTLPHPHAHLIPPSPPHPPATLLLLSRSTSSACSSAPLIPLSPFLVLISVLPFLPAARLPFGDPVLLFLCQLHAVNPSMLEVVPPII